MELGKLNLKDLKYILENYTGVKKKETLLRSALGEDVSVIDVKSLKDDLILISSDPITLTSENIGKFSIEINTNDIYSSGGEGYGVTLTILIPENKTLCDFKNIMEEIHKECIVHNLEILGGHTEVTKAVNDIVVCVTIIGVTKRNLLKKTSGCEEGDLIFLTKTLGIEGTLLLYKDFKEKFGDIYKKEEEIFSNSISIREECRILREFNVSSMHDITEGGLLGALFEMSLSSGKGFKIFKENVKINPFTEKMCKEFNKDVLRLISSGNLLFTSKKEYKDEILNKMKEKNIECFMIGEIIKRDTYLINDKGKDINVPFHIKDSYL